MKKRIFIGIALFIISIILVTTANADFTMTMDLSVDSSDIKLGEEVTYTITLNESIVACNFDITYNNTVLQFVGSQTDGLTAAVNENVVSCIYFDINQVGTSKFNIKFKAIAESNEQTALGVTNVKFRAKDKEKSYTASDIRGAEETVKIEAIVAQTTVEEEKNNNINNNTTNNTNNNIINNDTTVVTSQLPHTGKNKLAGYILMIASLIIIFSGITKYKEVELKKIFKSGGVMVLALTLMSGCIIKSDVYAAENNIEIKFFNGLIANKNNAIIIVNEKNKDNVTKQEVKSLSNNITNIKDESGKELEDTDKVKTGDIILQGISEYVIILYGDSSKDGIICDTDDIMTIIYDYIGEKKLLNEEKIAANLENSDDILDIDDLMKMVNSRLGKTGSSPTNIPKGDEQIENSNNQNVKMNITFNNVSAFTNGIKVEYKWKTPENKDTNSSETLNTLTENMTITKDIPFVEENNIFYFEITLSDLDNDEFYGKIIAQSNEGLDKIAISPMGLEDNSYTIESDTTNNTINLVFDLAKVKDDKQEEETYTSLASVAQLGDYVNYPITYTNPTSYIASNPTNVKIPTRTGWIISNISSNKVTLISAGMPEQMTVQDMNDVDQSSIYGYLKYKSFVDNTALKYKDANYANSANFCVLEEDIINSGLNTIIKSEYDDNRINASFATSCHQNCWYRYGKHVEINANYVLNPNYLGTWSPGIMVKVELKVGIKTSGKDANGVWQLVAE